MQRLRAAVIGLGTGHGHVREYLKHPAVDVVGIADVDAARLDKVGAEFGLGNRYTSAEELLAAQKPDVVSVATPNKFHAPLTIMALEAGCHVLCEKPMAMNAEEGAAMIEAARQADRRLMINFSYRFLPQSQALKREVDSGTLGDVYFARTIWLRRMGMPRFGGWFGRKELSGGGPLIDLGVHRLDLALWLMGYPRPVWVMGSTYSHLARERAAREQKLFDVEDLAVALVKFENGAVLELEASWASHIQEQELMLTRLLGTRAGLVQRNLNGTYEFEAEIYLERNGHQTDLRLRVAPESGSNAMLHFADAILDGTPHIATGEEGRTVMKLLDAIYASSHSGEPVRIEA